MKPGDTEGEVVGYIRGGLNVYAKVGNCKCRGGKPKSSGRCKSVGGASGSIEVTATFVDIKVGDGRNGVDVSLYITALICTISPDLAKALCRF